MCACHPLALSPFGADGTLLGWRARLMPVTQTFYRCLSYQPTRQPNPTQPRYVRSVQAEAAADLAAELDDCNAKIAMLQKHQARLRSTNCYFNSLLTKVQYNGRDIVLTLFSLASTNAIPLHHPPHLGLPLGS